MGIEEWRSTYIVVKREKLVDIIRQIFPEDEIWTIIEGSELGC